jgi:hypothetical protein
MAFPFDSSGKDKMIDFNFPQDVSKEALTDLDKALKAGDGELTVDALVRYSIAQSGISQDNMPDIINRLETVINKEKQPHIKALLYYFEAMVYQGCRDRFDSFDRNNPVEEIPADVSEWDRTQFNHKIAELIEKSLAEPDALKKVAVTSLPGIIRCNELGATYVPTLFEFLSMKGLEMLDEPDELTAPIYNTIYRQWVEGTEGNVPAHIFAIREHFDGNHLMDAYQRYRDNEHCAMLLPYLTFSSDKTVGVNVNKVKYAELQDYLRRFPESIYTNEVKNSLINMERKYISAVYPKISSTRDSIKVTSHGINVNDFTLNVYQVEDFTNYRVNSSKLKLVTQIPVKVQGKIPFEVTDITTMLPPLPYGQYIIVPRLGHETYLQDFTEYQVLSVTDIALFMVAKPSNKSDVAAVNISTGKPLPDVTIQDKSNKKSVITYGTTGSDGLLRIDANKQKNRYPEFYAVKGDDHYGPGCQGGFMSEGGENLYVCDIYTDLGVYRPGETIHWAAIVQHITDKKSVPVSGKKVWVGFSDSNDEEIDSLITTTDEFGRIEGSFIVPKDRMNGQFSIQVESRFDDEDDFEDDEDLMDKLGYHSVSVSEYKTPTFEVTFPDTRRSYVAGQSVKVTGKAMTYSGLPVQNTEVDLSLIQHEWSWWGWRIHRNWGEHLQDTTVMTDEQGNFTIEFPADLFEENKDYKPGKRCWARHSYTVVATVTTDAGETHEESTVFIVGTRRGIELGSVNDDIYLNDKPIKLPLKYNTTDEEHPNTFCTWEVTPIDGKEPVKTGNLNTADPTIDLTDLPSGQYKLKIHILDAEEGEEDVDVERGITLYLKGDKTPPVKDCPMWLTPLEQTVDKKNVGHITIGVSTPEAYIYYVAYTVDGIIGEGWLHYKKGMNDFTVQLPKKAGKDVTVNFISHYGTKSWRKTVTLQNPYLPEALKINATSFRNKLVPGDTEHWTFTLTDQNGKPLRGAMLLEMYDKAIASIQENPWLDRARITNKDKVAYISNMNLDFTATTNANWMGNQLPIPESAIAKIPELYVYNQRLFGYAFGRGRMMMKGVSNAELSDIVVKGYSKADKRIFTEETETGFGLYGARAAGVQADWAEQEEVLLDMSADETMLCDVVTVAEPKVNEKNLEKVILRESDVKTALWRPMLTSDDKGNINVEFEAPNFNTTWITQAVAWDKRMIGSSWMAEVLTQKPLMVRANMPRFLRQGDKATLAATVQNATDEAATCDAVIELFDPRTGDIYANRKFNLQLDANGSQAVTIDWQVPDTIAMMGFRIKAANANFGDGEQVMVPVLTTISPVIETEPFYIEAAQSHHEVTLPKFPTDARVTLEYCDNPTWYCVLALPTIFSDEYNVATHAAHSLFALQVAQGVAKEQPLIKEAVNYWKQHNEDSTLVSMLQKNQDLKIGTLLASPWVREADRQTLRMSKLNELFDDAIAKKEYEKIVTALQSLQMDDGGFTWFRYPGCKSNVWTTGTVLELIGEIKHLGYRPDDKRITDITKRALAFYDDENVRLLNEAKKYSKEPYSQFTDYAYVRSLFPEVKQHSGASADLFKKTLKYMDKNWSKGITLKQKAYYAMTLNRNGYQKTARSIVESIRQFAIVKPSLGMYWDNLQTGYGWWEFDKVAYTSTILQAMNEVDPRQQEIDQIRKWMLLMKQSNDWGSNSLAADAVYSILSTGRQWLDRGATPTITIAGQPVNLDKMAQWLGYFRTSLPATTAGSVVIERTGKGPAWGAVYSQFKAPMTEIKEKAIEEMSISKEYYVYAQDGTLHKTDAFNVGDKVKVRVVIKTNKDMDFVTMTDERAACFEPVDQLSGYRSEDNTWFYQETKDTQTNVFINSLNKGTHIIGYDVWVTNPGEFTSGIATIQCQYAPQLSAHSAGKTIIATGK